MVAQFFTGAPLIVRLPGIPQPELSPIGNGYIYFDASSGKFRVSEDGGIYVDLATGGDVTLDAAYDGGGAGLGRVIGVDAGAVVVNKTPADATNALEVNVIAGSGAAIQRTGFDEWTGIAAPAISPLGAGRIYFDSASAKFRMSENNGAYTDLGTTTLDAAYNGGGAGLGRTISVNAGAVVLNKTPVDGTNAIEVNVIAGSGAAIQRVGFDEWAGVVAPTTAPLGAGRVYFDSASSKFRVSENGGAYVDLVAETLEQVLSIGNTTGANDIVISSGQKVVSAAASALTFDGTTGLEFRTASALRWSVDSGPGSLFPAADNAVDVGVGVTNRIRTLYAGTSVVVGSSVTITTAAIDASANLSIDTGAAGTLALASTNASIITVGTGASVIWLQGNTTITGDLTVNGTVTTVNTTNMTISDQEIIIASQTVPGPEVRSAYVVERGTSGDDLLFYWNTSPTQVELGFFDTVGGTVTPGGSLSVLADVRLASLVSAGVAADPSVSVAGDAKVIYNTSTNALRMSLNGGAYANFVTSASSGLLSLQGAYDGGAAITTSLGQGPASIMNPAATAQTALLVTQNTAGQLAIDATGDCRVTGKLTVTGVIDPTQVLLSGPDKRFGATDAGPVYLAPFVDAVAGVQVRRADNTTVVLDVDTTNQRVGVGTAAPTATFHVSGTARIGGSTANTVIEQSDGSATTVSAASEGRLRYNATGQFFEISENAGAYARLGSATTGGGWTDDGGVVRLTTVGDGVGIGVAAIAAASKLEVLGDATRRNVLLTGGPGTGTIGGSVTIAGGTGGGGANAGGSISLTAGQGVGPGGALTLTGGQGGGASGGGNVTISAGSGGSGTGPGGTVFITGGSVLGADVGGPVVCTGGTSAGANAGGALSFAGGTGGPSGAGGSASFSAGAAGGGSAAGGGLSLAGGAGSAGGVGGSVSLIAGAGGSSGIGGATTISGGTGGTGGGGNSGGAVAISGGNAGGTAVGANVTLAGGLGGVAAQAGGALIFQTARAGAGTTLAERLRIPADGALAVTGIATANAPAASAASSGRLYFDSTNQAFMVSENTGAYRRAFPLVTTASSSASTGAVTSAAFVAIAAMTITTTAVTGAGTYVIWFSGSMANSAASTADVTIFVGGAEAASSRVTSVTAGAVTTPVTCLATQAVAAGTVIDVRWRSSAGSLTMVGRTFTIQKVA